MDEKQNPKSADIYNRLKYTGSVIEQQLNQFIQDFINHEEIVSIADVNVNLLTNKLKVLQQYVEVLSAFLHFPTKDDIANVAKLTIQVEDKVDKLEEHLLELTKLIQANIENEVPVTQVNVEPVSKEPVFEEPVSEEPVKDRHHNNNMHRVVDLQKETLIRRWNDKEEATENNLHSSHRHKHLLDPKNKKKKGRKKHG